MGFIEVKGDSMSPLLEPNQILYMREIDAKDIIHNHILVFQYFDKLLIKRVVGLPGDTVTIEDQIVDVNGEEIFTYADSTSQFYQWNLQDNQYCVIGDNPRNSLDSRKIGVITENDIKYRIRARIWPPKLF